MSDVISRLRSALAGRYHVERELGQGGMATVYLAQDLRHDRNVALKVLHEDLGATLGPERFLAEIKTTARLQHPHILPLLDSGSTEAEGKPGGLLYYVMPYVDGESLRDRLDRETQLPIDDAVRIAREIADALGFAHGLGVVHRDIKPENILLQGGHALVADFGIALAVQQAGGARLTQTGLSLGTPQYMAPEQAMGEKSIDARADIYALGAVTYEMLVGEPPFTGATVQAIVAKVLSSDPEPPTTMRKTIPAHVEEAVLTALAKLPADRFATAVAFAAALGGGASGGNSGARSQAARPGRRSIGEQGRAWAIAGMTVGVFAGVALGYVAWARSRTSDAKASVSRSYVMLPPGEALPAGTTDFVISPTGDDIVYVGPGEQPHTTQLWRKRRAELHATRIAGTVSGYGPFFSPDGGSIAFYTPTGLVKLALAGGAPVTIGAGMIGADSRGAWLEDGRIAATSKTDLFLLSSDGSSRELFVSNTTLVGYNPYFVEPLPQARGVLIQACPAGCSRATIYVADAKTKAAKVLLDGRSPHYLASGHLAFVSVTGALMVAPFDLASLTLTGAAVPVAERVSRPTISRNGTLVYRESDPGEAYRFVWVDRTGKATVVDTSWLAHISSFTLSLDGRRLAVSIVTEGLQHIFLKDLPNGPLSKFTSGPLNHFRPVWSSDGRIIWFIRGDRQFELVEKNADGSGDVRIVRAPGHQVVESAASNDGTWLLMRTGGTDTARAILATRRGVDSLPQPLRVGRGTKLGLALSPDAKFIAFASGTSGRPEVYVTPFPNMDAAQWQVSLAGANEPRWSHDGKSLYYVNLNQDLMVARLRVDNSVSVESTTKLFNLDGYQRDGGFHVYEADPTEQRFLMVRREIYPGELVVVENWSAELRDKLKAKK